MVPVRELANRYYRTGTHYRRNDGRHAAAVRQSEVHDGTVRVESLSVAVGDHLQARLQRTLFKLNARQRLDLAVLLNPDRRVWVHHDFGDGFGFEQVFDRSQEWNDYLEAQSGILSGSKSICSWSNHVIVMGKKSSFK